MGHADVAIVVQSSLKPSIYPQPRNPMTFFAKKKRPVISAGAGLNLDISYLMCKQTASPLPSVDQTSITTMGLFHGSLRRKRWIDRGQRSLLKSEKPVVDTILVLELPKTRCFMCAFGVSVFLIAPFFLSVRMFSFCFFCKKLRCCYFCFTTVDKFQTVCPS